MNLQKIVNHYGGEGFHGFTRASIPAPGHSRNDTSVSLFLDPSGRVRVHCFSSTHTWQEIIKLLKDDGFIDSNNILDGAAGGLNKPAFSVTTDHERLRRAEDLWASGYGIRGSMSEQYLRRFRKVGRSVETAQFRHIRAAPASIYAPSCRYTYPAFASRISDDKDTLIGVEITYLAPNSARLEKLRIPRKTVGNLTPFENIAVRIDEPAEEMLVGEGVPTVLSASE